MISFEHRILSEYRIKRGKVDTLAHSIMTHREPNGMEAREASDFLDVLVNEIDRFYKENSAPIDFMRNCRCAAAQSRKSTSTFPSRRIAILATGGKPKSSSLSFKNEKDPAVPHPPGQATTQFWN